MFFLNPPTDNFEIVDTDSENLQVINYPGFVKGLRHFPTFLIKLLTRRIFQKLEKLAKVQFDIVWTFDNSVFFQLDALPTRVFKISHIVDLNMNFETRKAAQTASVCFCNSKPIQSRLETFTEKVNFVNHGLSISEKQTSINLEMPSKVNVGYAGNLDIKYLDWQLINRVAKQHPEIHFHFAGTLNSQKVKNLIGESENLFHVGTLPSSSIQSFYMKMDVLILIYLADDFKNQLANPHKVLEYLYSGKPVIATFTKEYEDKDLLYMSKDNNEWPSVFEDVMNNLYQYSRFELAEKRKKYAQNHTYDKQIDRIDKILASLPA